MSIGDDDDADTSCGAETVVRCQLTEGLAVRPVRFTAIFSQLFEPPACVGATPVWHFRPRPGVDWWRTPMHVGYFRQEAELRHTEGCFRSRDREGSCDLSGLT